MIYPFLSNEITIDVHQAVGVELAQAGIAPQQYPPGDNPADDWARVVTCYPFLRIVEGLDKLPFTSFPELRYRLGNYSFMTGRDVIINEDGTVTTFPYFAHPEFLLYERSQLRPFRFTLLKDFLDDVPDEISYDVDGLPALPAQFFYMTSFYFGSNALENGYGLALNLVQDIVADLAIYYTWGTLQLSDSPPAQKVIFPF